MVPLHWKRILLVLKISTFAAKDQRVAFGAEDKHIRRQGPARLALETNAFGAGDELV